MEVFRITELANMQITAKGYLHKAFEQIEL